MPFHLYKNYLFFKGWGTWLWIRTFCLASLSSFHFLKRNNHKICWITFSSENHTIFYDYIKVLGAYAYPTQIHEKKLIFKKNRNSFNHIFVTELGVLPLTKTNSRSSKSAIILIIYLENILIDIIKNFHLFCHILL